MFLLIVALALSQLYICPLPPIAALACHCAHYYVVQLSCELLKLTMHIRAILLLLLVITSKFCEPLRSI